MAVQCQPGRYAATIVSHKLGTASTGNVQLAFVLNILGIIRPDDPDSYDASEGGGLTRTVIRTITEKTVNRIYRELDTLGYTGDGFSALDQNLSGDKFIDLSGKQVYVRMHPEEYQGNERERWEFDQLGAGEGIPMNPVERNKAREIDTMFSRKKVSPGGAAPNTNSKASGSPGNRRTPAKTGTGTQSQEETTPW